VERNLATVDNDFFGHCGNTGLFGVIDFEGAVNDAVANFALELVVIDLFSD
jgi:hypothetical protein